MRGTHGAKLEKLEGARESSRPFLPKDDRKSDVNGHERCDDSDQREKRNAQQDSS
jgi:hypothetical protein